LNGGKQVGVLSRVLLCIYFEIALNKVASAGYMLTGPVFYAEYFVILTTSAGTIHLQMLVLTVLVPLLVIYPNV